jgi:hypothetical protein
VLQTRNDDVELLLQSATQRYDQRTQNKKQAPWMPCYERMIYQGKQKPATDKRSGQLLYQVLSKEEIAAHKKRLDLKDGKEEVRKNFSVEEWLYILRGEEATKKRSDSDKRNSFQSRDLPVHQQNQGIEPSQISLPASIINTSQHSSRRISHNSVNSCDFTGYKGGGNISPSYDVEYETSSLPQANLQDRRNVQLPPIRTCEI